MEVNTVAAKKKNTQDQRRIEELKASYTTYTFPPSCISFSGTPNIFLLCVVASLVLSLSIEQLGYEVLSLNELQSYPHF